MMRGTMVLAGALFFAAPAFASNDDISVLTRYGLIGSHWAVDCSKPMSASNYYASYSVGPNGSPVQTLRTPQSEKVREMRNVQAISASWFVFTMMDENQQAFDILFKIEGNREKTWRSVAQGGKAYILNGKGNTADPPWFQRCK